MRTRSASGNGKAYNDAESYINPITSLANDSYDDPPISDLTLFKPLPPVEQDKAGSLDAQQVTKEEPDYLKKPLLPVQHAVQDEPILLQNPPELLAPAVVMVSSGPTGPEELPVTKEPLPVQPPVSDETPLPISTDTATITAQPSAAGKPAVPVKPLLPPEKGVKPALAKPAIPVKPVTPFKLPVQEKPAVPTKPLNLPRKGTSISYMVKI